MHNLERNYEQLGSETRIIINHYFKSFSNKRIYHNSLGIYQIKKIGIVSIIMKGNISHDYMILSASSIWVKKSDLE